MNIIHLADLHLGRKWLRLIEENGLNMREQRLYDLTSEVIEEAKSYKPDIIVIAGDLYDNMTPTSVAHQHAFRFVRALRKIAPVLIVAGNHDHAKTSTLSPLVHFDEFFECDLAMTQTHFDYEDEHGTVRFHCMPYQALAAHIDGKQPLEPFEFIGRDVLVAHGYAFGARVSSPPEHVVIPSDILHDKRFALIMLGHIHQHVQLDPDGNAYYAGPLQPLNYGESELKPAYWTHEIDATGAVKSTSVALPHQPFVIWRINARGLGTDELHQMVLDGLRDRKDLEGTIGKIVVNDCSEEIRQSALPATWEQVYREVGGLHCEIDLRSQEVQKMLDVEFAEVPPALEEAYRAYLKNAKRDDLVDLAMTTLQQAREHM